MLEEGSLPSPNWVEVNWVEDRTAFGVRYVSGIVSQHSAQE
jgi:hypothetical protein